MGIRALARCNWLKSWKRETSAKRWIASKRWYTAGDAAGLDALLTAHPELRDALDDPHFDFGSTALIILKENLDAVDKLLRHGADINATSQWWAGDFHILEGASAETAKALVERGAEITAHAAAEQGWLDWLEARCEIDPTIAHARGGDGKTPLHYADDPRRHRLAARARRGHGSARS